MNRLGEFDRPANDQVRAMYAHVLAGWAFDLLCWPPRITWPQADPAADHRNRDWRRLYDGSVLDD